MGKNRKLVGPFNVGTLSKSFILHNKTSTVNSDLEATENGLRNPWPMGFKIPRPAALGRPVPCNFLSACLCLMPALSWALAPCICWVRPHSPRRRRRVNKSVALAPKKVTGLQRRVGKENTVKNATNKRNKLEQTNFALPSHPSKTANKKLNQPHHRRLQFEKCHTPSSSRVSAQPPLPPRARSCLRREMRSKSRAVVVPTGPTTRHSTSPSSGTATSSTASSTTSRRTSS